MKKEEWIAGIIVFIVVFSLICGAEASSVISIRDIDICDHGDSLYGEVTLKNQGVRNVTALLIVHVDNAPVYVGLVRMNVKEFKGFIVSRVAFTEFQVNNEVGKHKMVVCVLAEGKVQEETYEYTVYEPPEEESSEESGGEVEDWLKCP